MFIQEHKRFCQVIKIIRFSYFAQWNNQFDVADDELPIRLEKKIKKKNQQSVLVNVNKKKSINQSINQ